MGLSTIRPRARSIRLIQRGTIAFAAESSLTATITSVETAKSLLSHLGATTGGSSLSASSIRLELTNSTTVTAIREGTASASTVGFQVETGW